jgi:transketolase
MRTTIINTLVELAEKDPRIILLTGDLGFMVIDPFMKFFPDRFINVGVAEQNMIGIATGLAESGLIPFVYSIAPFAALRPYEFIRNGPIAHQLPVRILGIGTGVDYSTNGLTHYALEDLGVMRIQPAITSIAPADAPQARSALLATWDKPGPIYFSLGKDDRIVIPELDGRFTIGDMETICSGKDIIIISIGSVTREVLLARIELNKQGIYPTLSVVSSLNPVNTEQISEELSHFHLVFTVESHYVNGGLGSMIAEIIAENNLDCKLVRCGFRNLPDGKTGTLNYMYSKNKLSHVEIANEILHALVKNTSLLDGQ